MFRRLLKALRLDDVLALLFTGALLVLGFAYSVEFVHRPLQYFFLLVLYLGVAFLVVRRVLGSGLGKWTKRLFLSVFVAFVAFFALVASDGRPQGNPGIELSLTNLKNLGVLILPVAIAWWTRIRPGSDGIRAQRSGESTTLGQVLRDYAPFLVSQAAYLLLHDMVHAVSPLDRDTWLIAADEAFFGGAATQWLEPYVHPWLTEWFSATYSMFLFFPLALALWFSARGERSALLHLLQAVVLCNYIGYIGYLLVPAVGPMYTLHFDAPLTGGWFYATKESLDVLARAPRDCFPSLHTANTFVVLLVVWRYSRSLAWIYLPLGTSCIAATIYLRYHYTVDVLAGLLLGGAIVVGVPWLAGAWERLVDRYVPGPA